MPIPLLKGRECHGEWRMDWLDKFTITIIAVISLITIGMLANQEIIKRRQGNSDAVSKAEKARYYAMQKEINAKIYQEVVSLKEQGLYEEALAKLQDVMKTYPGKSLSYVYLAQLSLERGKLADAINNYRLAVEKEPDYVDKRTPLFIGREIKAQVTEGLVLFGREKALKPKDKEVRKVFRNLYYLQRRLAGGCE